MTKEKEKFERDLAFGQIGEKVVADFLKTEFGMEFHGFNESQDREKLKEFDFTMVDWKSCEMLDIEVKTDAWEFFKKKDTGNITIEYYCSGTASGIFTTKAHKFIYYMPYHEIMYMCDTEVLRGMIRRQEIPFAPVSAGDKKKTRCALIRRVDFEEHFTAIKIPAKYLKKYHKDNV